MKKRYWKDPASRNLSTTITEMAGRKTHTSRILHIRSITKQDWKEIYIGINGLGEKRVAELMEEAFMDKKKVVFSNSTSNFDKVEFEFKPI